MKKLYVVFWMAGLAALVYANPLPPAEVVRISAYPPEIEIEFNDFDDSLDISGFGIFTTQGTATIDTGTYVCYGDWPIHFILDSSNTSGFAINPECDTVYTDIEIWGYPFMYDACRFGNMGYHSPPIKGHPTVLKHYPIYYPNEEPFPRDHYSFDFANPDFGWTDIVINEINAHGIWRNNANFIELYNKSDESLNLDGWQIVCDTVLDLPVDAFIPASGFYVVDESFFPATFDMDYSSDNIYLISPDSRSYINAPRIVDQVGWSSDHGENVSFMRFPDGDVDSTTYMGDFLGFSDGSSITFENGFPTRSAANRHVCPGFVVIGARADSIDEITAHIHWTDPIWDDQFSYSALVRSYDSYPESPADGELLYTGTDQEFTDMFIPPADPSYYTVFAYDLSGNYSIPTAESKTYIWFNAVDIDEVTIPRHISYLNCYPNPFNARTTISFSLKTPGVVELSIYDIAGRLVEIIAEGSYPAGEHSVVWDADNYSSGIYFARLQIADIAYCEKLVYMK